MILIGITGTNGSGKGTVVEYLVSEHSFCHYAARDFLTQEIERRSLPVDRNTMRLVANELRETHEPAYVIASLYAQAEQEKTERVVIESVRNVGEAEFLKLKGAVLIAVDADQKMRYTRVQSRRSATDQVDFVTFVHHEEREMQPVGPHDMDLHAVMGMADFTLTNSGTLEELHTQIEKVLRELPL